MKGTSEKPQTRTHTRIVVSLVSLGCMDEDLLLIETYHKLNNIRANTIVFK
jgi:hypothetical protein